jgi:hypothetical protein
MLVNYLLLKPVWIPASRLQSLVDVKLHERPLEVGWPCCQHEETEHGEYGGQSTYQYSCIPDKFSCHVFPGGDAFFVCPIWALGLELLPVLQGHTLSLAPVASCFSAQAWSSA